MPAGPAIEEQEQGDQPAPAVETPTAEETVNLDGLSLKELDRFMQTGELPSGKSGGEVEKPSNNKPKDGKPPQSKHETDDGQEVQHPEGQKRYRIHLGNIPKNEADTIRQIRDMIAEGGATSVAEAVQKLGGAPVKPKAESADDGGGRSEAEVAEPSQPKQSDDQEVAGIEAEIQKLEAEKEEALSEYDSPTAIKIAERIMDLKLDLREAKRNATQREAQAKTFVEQQTAFIQQAMDQFPDLNDEGSLFYEMFTEARRAEEHPQSPDPVMDRPDWAIVLGNRVKERINRIGGRQQPQHRQEATEPRRSAPAGTIPQPPAPRQTARPTGQLAPSGSPTEPISREEASNRIQSLSLKDLDRLMA